MKQIRFRLAAYTDPAGKRNNEAPLYGNEDNLFVDADLSNGIQGEFVTDQEELLHDKGCLMVVTDGMGGMNAGEVASEIAIQTVLESFTVERLSQASIATAEERQKYMEDVVVSADAAIKNSAKPHPEYEGMGSTIVMAWLYGNEVTVTWCGDSRAYIYRDSEGIVQISKDHSYVQQLVDEGMEEYKAFDHPYGNIITRSLGDPVNIAKPDSKSVPIYKGDIILVCSDGLNGVLRDRKTYDFENKLLPGDNIEDIIRANRTSMLACREALWQAAEKAEWYDNVTAILCEIIDGDSLETAVITNNITSDPADTEDCIEMPAKTKSFIELRIRKKSLLQIAIAIVCVAFMVCMSIFCRHESPIPDHEDVILEDSTAIKDPISPEGAGAPEDESKDEEAAFNSSEGETTVRGDTAIPGSPHVSDVEIEAGITEVSESPKAENEFAATETATETHGAACYECATDGGAADNKY